MGLPAAAMAALILIPLAAAALAFAVPARGRSVGLAAAAGTAAAAAALARQVLGGGTLRHAVGGWGAALGIDLRADGLSALMLLLTAGIGVAVTLYAPAYFARAAAHDDGGAGGRAAAFWPLWLFLWAALNALFLSADIFNLYVTLELLGFSAVLLVALAGGRAALGAAMRYLLVSLAGSLSYLLGVALAYRAAATVDLGLLAGRIQGDPAAWAALALMTAGLLMKAALFPMHFWLPPAHANAPAPVSALLSALVVKGAFYILLRLWFEGFRVLAAPGAAQWLGVLGGAAIVWGSVQALVQERLKLLIAYSTVAQLGYLFLIFPLALPPADGFAAWGGGLIFLGAHACAKAAMFLSAGNILQAAGHDRIRDLDGITHVLPVSVFAFALAGMSLVGLPPSGGFAGKWLLLGAGLAQGQWWWVAIILGGSLLAAAYVMRVLTHAFTRVPDPTTPNPVPPVMEWTAFGLGLLAALLGALAAGPAALLAVGPPLPVPAAWGGTAP